MRPLARVASVDKKIRRCLMDESHSVRQVRDGYISVRVAELDNCFRGTQKSWICLAGFQIKKRLKNESGRQAILYWRLPN